MPKINVLDNALKIELFYSINDYILKKLENSIKSFG